MQCTRSPRATSNAYISVMKRVALAVLLCLCTACANRAPGITSEEAIQRARSLVSVNQPEIEATNVPLTNVRAESMTYAEASNRVWKDASVPAGQDPQRRVWVVTMDGEWHSAFPAPTGTAPQQPLHHFAVIIDATTGDMFGSSARP